MNSRQTFTRTLLVLAFVGSAGLAFWFGNQMVKAKRGPASVSPEHVFTDLSGSQLERAIKDRLIKESKSFIRTGVFGMELGHFALRDASGRVRSACEMYPRMRVRYAAGDMAVNGERPTLTVEGDCVTGYDQDSIAPLLVPYADLKKEVPESRTFPPQIAFGNTIVTDHLADAWPDLWILEHVELIDANGTVGYSIGENEIRDIRGGQIIEIR